MEKVPGFSAALRVGLVCLVCLGSAAVVRAGGTPATSTVADELITITGSESRTEDGDYLSARDGLDSYHSFFIEVPVGATSLEVDLYDMDVLYGIDDGTNTEQVAERDRIRAYQDYLDDPVGNFNSQIFGSAAKYELFDPDGNAVVTKHVYGNHFAPGDADGAWLNFYDSDLADTSSGDQFLDQFGSASYSNNNGTVSFAGPWIEDEQAGVNPTGTGAGPSAGLVRITGGRLRLSDVGDFPTDLGREPRIHRELDLDGYTSAVLSFDFFVPGTTDKSDALAIEVSDDGGTTWAIIDAVSSYNGSASGSVSYDISDFISSTTQVRFRIENLFAGGSEEVFIDNFEVRATADAAAAPQAGHWELRVDMSSGANGGTGFNGDETNAFGFRAHDGDETAGGTEYNVYTYHYTAGINPNDSGRDYTLYPLITSGCDFSVNDFDWDADLPSNTAPDPDLDPPFGSLVVTSPDTAFSSSSVLSANDAWAGSTATGFSADAIVDDYGVWTLDARVEDPIDGNYAPIYIGTYEDLDLAPATIPDPESFRIYLPTDGGGAPIKPYLTQRLTVFTTQPSGGSNPPAEGETTRYAVSVVVWNPDGSSGDITFDAGRVVRAHLPGGDVTFRGVSFVTQGTVISAPAVGSNTAGDVVWNPGTVAAGSGSDSTASLVYAIDVTGPAVPYTVEVTGAPGSGNGTRAVWLDETGDLDFSTGELCQLQLVNAAAVPVVVSSVEATELRGEPALRWTTASEAGTRAFEVLRVDDDGRATKIHEHPVSAWIGHAAGGSYRIADPDAPRAGSAEYWIVEIDSRGRRNPHGPFEVSFENPGIDTKDGPRLTDTLSAERFARAERRRREAAKSRAETTVRGSVEAVQVGVDRTGVQRLSVAETAAAFGVAESTIRDEVADHDLRLTLDDEPVAWLRGTDDDLLFYGRALDTPYTDRRVYRLERRRGRSMVRRPAGTLPPDWGEESFRDSLWIEENLRPVVILDGLDPESDNWLWGFVRPGGAEAELDFAADVPDVAPSSQESEVEVHLLGGAEGEHRVDLLWNGHELGSVDVSGPSTVIAPFTFPAAWLADGENTLRMRAVSGSLVFLEGFRLTYERRAQALNDAATLTLEDLTLEDRAVATVAGFGDADLRVFDVTDPELPSWIHDPLVLPETDGLRVVFPVSVPPSRRSRHGSARGPRTFVAVSDGGLISPILEPDQPSNWAADHPGVDYLVIAAPELLDAAQALVDYRQSRGLESRLVSLTDVYDEFAGGLRDPRALRAFLDHVWKAWTDPPRLVALVGHGTYDFRDHWGLGDNLLPPLLAARPGSLFPTDALFGDPVGDDGAPEMAVGRIPALSPEEVASYVAKLQAYEALGDVEWDHRLLAVADDADGAGDFAEVSRHLQELIGFGFEPVEMHLDDQPDVATARQVLFDALADGAALTHYQGHGAVDRLTGDGLLLAADVPELGNADRPTVLTAATCNIGLHAFPGFDGLAETLVMEPGKGAIAALAPAWLLDENHGRTVADRLFRRLFQQSERVLGEAIRRAFEDAATHGVPAHALRAYQILGDPALELQLRRRLPDPGCESDCGNG